MLHRSRLRFSDEALVFHMVTMACYGHAEKIWNNAYPHQNYHDNHQTSLSALFTNFHILSFRKIFLNTKKSGCSESDSDCSFSSELLQLSKQTFPTWSSKWRFKPIGQFAWRSPSWRASACADPQKANFYHSEFRGGFIMFHQQFMDL